MRQGQQLQTRLSIQLSPSLSPSPSASRSPFRAYRRHFRQIRCPSAGQSISFVGTLATRTIVATDSPDCVWNAIEWRPDGRTGVRCDAISLRCIQYYVCVCVCVMSKSSRQSKSKPATKRLGGHRLNGGCKSVIMCLLFVRHKEVPVVCAYV